MLISLTFYIRCRRKLKRKYFDEGADGNDTPREKKMPQPDADGSELKTKTSSVSTR